MKIAEVKDAVKRASCEGFIHISTIDSALDDGECYSQNMKVLLSGLGTAPVVGLDPCDTQQPTITSGTENLIPLPGKPDYTTTAGWPVNNNLPRMTREDEARYAKRLEFFKKRMIHCLKARPPVDKAKKLWPTVKQYFGTTKRHCCTHNKVNHLRPICKVVGECPEGKAGFIQQCCSSYQWVRARFVERNLFLSIQVSRQYSTYAIPIMDLVQEGSTSLIRAVEKFDWRRGVRFQTYATFWIRQAMERWITANKGMVRVPNYLQQKMRRLKREGELSTESSTLSIHDVAGLFNLPSEVAGRLLETSRAHLSLDSVSSKENDNAIKTKLSVREETTLSEADYRKLQTLVTEVFSELTRQERFILKNRFGLGGGEAKTLEAIGKTLGVSRERVRQIQLRALGKLKKPSLAHKLTSFLT